MVSVPVRRNTSEGAQTVQELDAILERAERDQERLAAGLRLVIAAALFAAVATVQGQGAHHHPLLAATVIYAGVAVLGAWLAWRGFYHPLLPYAFATGEAVLLALQIVLMSKLLDMPSEMSFALPVSGLVFVLLVHASMRYRPWLVVYAAVVFGLSAALGLAIVEAVGDAPGHAAAIGGSGWFHELVHYQAFPVVTVGLVTLMLFVANTRMRALLRSHLANVVRVAKLSRYFSPSIARELASRTDEELFRGRRIQAAVLFADMRGFSRLAETMRPDELGDFLGELRARLARAVSAHGGTIDKFIGDSVMAVFGVPDGHPDDAAKAMGCAFDVIDVVREWSWEREARGLPPVAIGIGIHYGEVFAGVVGREHLLEFTVIGDTVNVAERLERLSRDLDTPLVVSAVCWRAAGHISNGRKWRKRSAQPLPGRNEALDVVYLSEDAPPHPAVADGEPSGEVQTLAEV